MNPSFYPVLVAFALLASCGDGESSDSASQAPNGRAEDVFAVPAEIQANWEAPENGDWTSRWIHHLEFGSQETIRFAKARLLEIGVEAAPALEAALLEGAAQERSFGRLVSLAEVLGACGRPESSDILLKVAETNSVTVVRTASLESVGALKQESAVPRLLALLPRQADAAPRTAALTALGKIGTPEAAAALESMVEEWLAGDRVRGGQESWNALLLIEKEHVIDNLRRLHQKLPPFQQVQSLTLRVGLGETGLAEELRPFLDPEEFPSAGTRSLALTALAELGDWDAVLGVREDPTPRMWMALVAQLRRPDAIAAHIGDDVLDVYTQSPDQDLMFNALLGLVERGESHRLEPWLRQLKEFPTGTGSMTALTLVSKPGMQDPRTAGILIERWDDCTPQYRQDLIGGLVRTGSPEAATFLAAVASDSREEEAIRHKATTVLSNFGEIAVAPLLNLWESEPTLKIAARVLPGLGRYPEDPRVQEFMMSLATDPEVPDAVRKEVIDLVPKIFGAEALPILLEMRESASRTDVRRYINYLLNSFF